MLSFNVINNIDILKTSQGIQAVPENLNEKFCIFFTDTLLSNTRQYERWKEIRQNDPSLAMRVAKLVMARHDL